MFAGLGNVSAASATVAFAAVATVASVSCPKGVRVFCCWASGCVFRVLLMKYIDKFSVLILYVRIASFSFAVILFFSELCDC